MYFKLFLKCDESIVLKLYVASRAELDLVMALISQTSTELKSASLWRMLQTNLALKRWHHFFVADCYRLVSIAADLGKNMNAFLYSIYKCESRCSLLTRLLQRCLKCLQEVISWLYSTYGVGLERFMILHPLSDQAMYKVALT